VRAPQISEPATHPKLTKESFVLCFSAPKKRGEAQKKRGEVSDLIREKHSRSILRGIKTRKK
jgi:hypothetical protein